MEMKERKRVTTGEGHPPVRRAKREICSRCTPLDHTTAVRRVSEAQACTFCPFRIQVFGSHHSNVISGSQERKLQRRSIRSRSESERGSDPVPKKKTKKEQVSVYL